MPPSVLKRFEAHNLTCAGEAPPHVQLNEWFDKFTEPVACAENATEVKVVQEIAKTTLEAKLGKINSTIWSEAGKNQKNQRRVRGKGKDYYVFKHAYLDPETDQRKPQQFVKLTVAAITAASTADA